jgi:hypothetical protein
MTGWTFLRLCRQTQEWYFDRRVSRLVVMPKLFEFVFQPFLFSPFLVNHFRETETCVQYKYHTFKWL